MYEQENTVTDFHLGAIEKIVSFFDMSKRKNMNFSSIKKEKV